MRHSINVIPMILSDMAFTSRIGFFLLYTISILLMVWTDICYGDRRPDLMVAELEHLLVDFNGANAGLFGSGITPCSFYFSGAQTTGRETAAQWVRAAFRTKLRKFTTEIALANSSPINR